MKILKCFEGIELSTVQITKKMTAIVEVDTTVDPVNIRDGINALLAEIRPTWDVKELCIQVRL